MTSPQYPFWFHRHLAIWELYERTVMHALVHRPAGMSLAEACEMFLPRVMKLTHCQPPYPFWTFSGRWLTPYPLAQPEWPARPPG